MADTKMVVVAFLFIAMLMASSTPTVNSLCLPDCYDRCANGKEGNTACSEMCALACTVPTTLPDGTDLASLHPGGI